jgi:DNA modification methylase
MRETELPPSRKSRVLRLAPSVAKKNARLLARLDSDLPVTCLSGFSDLVNYAPRADEPVHRWFPYREGYSTRLVSGLIDSMPRNQRILDPFCGCGTTLIAGQKLGFGCDGLEVNPLSVLVTRVKTRHYSSSDRTQLERYKRHAENLAKSSPSLEPPALKIIDRLFHSRILKTLLALRLFIEQIPNDKHREFLMTAWLSILEDVSNVYKEGNGIKYRNRKRTPAGYIPIPLERWQASAFPDDKHEFVLSRFAKHLGLMIDDLRLLTRGGSADVYNHSATEMDILAPSSIGFCMFSPPYCNCFNYFKAFKVELWMGGFVRTYHDIQELNRRALRSHVETPLKRPADEIIELVENFVELIDPDKLWDSRITHAIRGYFVDMFLVMRNLFRVLKGDARCVIVVGNSAYGGILIPTDSLLAAISRPLGFVVESIGVARHLTTSSQQKLLLEDRKAFLRESVVVLRKPKWTN